MPICSKVAFLAGAAEVTFICGATQLAFPQIDHISSFTVKGHGDCYLSVVDDHRLLSVDQWTLKASPCVAFLVTIVRRYRIAQGFVAHQHVANRATLLDREHHFCVANELLDVVL